MGRVATTLAYGVLAALCIAHVCAHATPAPHDDLLRHWFELRLDANHDGILSDVEMNTYFVSSGATHSTAEHLRRLLQDDSGAAFLAEAEREAAEGLTIDSFRGMYQRLDAVIGPSEPHEVHLALTGDGSEMRVMWVTTDEYDTVESATVAWGTSAGVYGEHATGTSYTYTVPKRWWGGFNGFIHEAVITGLDLATKYFYRVGGLSKGQMVWGGEFNFTSALPNTPEQKTTFVSYGDMGTVMPLGFAVTDIMVEAHREEEFGMIMHVGDLSYAGTDTTIKFLNISNTDECEWIWDLWGDQIQPLASQMPYMTGVGNHEVFYNWTAFTHRYHMPENGNGNFWFSYDHGNIHFTSLSTEHPYGEGTPQREWAKADLAKAAANRHNVPWIVVTGHRPMYCSDNSEWNQHHAGAPFQASIEPLMLEAQVDLLITGHMHCNERVHPVKNGTVVSMPEPGTNIYKDPLAAVQVVVGTAGAMQEETFRNPQPAWSAYRAADTGNSYGYGRFTAHNSTHFQYEFHPLSRNETAVVADSFWIVKSPQA